MRCFSSFSIDSRRSSSVLALNTMRSRWQVPGIPRRFQTAELLRRWFDSMRSCPSSSSPTARRRAIPDPAAGAIVVADDHHVTELGGGFASPDEQLDGAERPRPSPAQAARRRESTARSQPAIWFQLAQIGDATARLTENSRKEQRSTESARRAPRRPSTAPALLLARRRQAVNRGLKQINHFARSTSGMVRNAPRRLGSGSKRGR